MTLSTKQQALCDENTDDLSGLRAVFVNSSLKKVPQESHTRLLWNDKCQAIYHGKVGCRFDDANPDYRA